MSPKISNELNEKYKSQNELKKLKNMSRRIIFEKEIKTVEILSNSCSTKTLQNGHSCSYTLFLLCYIASTSPTAGNESKL